MFKNVVSLRLKTAVTTAHTHTVGVDAIRIDDDDTITKVVGHHSHLATGATHSVDTSRVDVRRPTFQSCVGGQRGTALDCLDVTLLFRFSSIAMVLV